MLHEHRTLVTYAQKTSIAALDHLKHYAQKLGIIHENRIKKNRKINDKSIKKYSRTSRPGHIAVDLKPISIIYIGLVTY